MTVICLQCQTTNSPKSRFCRSCGQPVTLPEQTNGETTGEETINVAESVMSENAGTVPETTRPLESEAYQPVAVTDQPAPVYIEEAPTASTASLVLEQTSSQPLPISMPQAIADEIRSELAEADPSRFSPDTIAINEDIPIRLSCNFNRLFLENCNTTFQIRLENQSPAPLESCIIRLECGGWEKPVERSVRRLAAGQRQVFTLGTMATRPGSWPLNCSIKGVSNGHQLAYFGTISVTTMTKPEANNMVVNIVNNQNLSNSGANGGLGEDVKFGDVKIGDLLNKEGIRGINDLIQIALPEKFEFVELSLDYEVSVKDVGDFVEKDSGALSIPKGFKHLGIEGNVLKLTPLSSPPGLAPLRPVHFCSRRLFKIGRTRTDGEFPAWFWPRNGENDEKTRRLSHWHCSMEWRDDGLWLVDNHATNYTTFDKVQVTEENPVKFTQRAEIGLAGSYFIEAMPFASAQPQGPTISNIRDWNGPQDTPRNAPQGCLRFTPTHSEPSYHEVIWLLADGTFGTNRSNPIVFDVPGLAEIQGRFHHWRGCYWLENTIDNGAVRVGTNSMKPDSLKSHQIVPLDNGQTLELGKAVFRVEVIR